MKTEIPINYDIEYPVLLRKYHELCNEFCGQRDAALKLAQKWERSERRFDRTGGNLEYYAYNGDRCAAELRDIFAPKKGK